MGINLEGTRWAKRRHGAPGLSGGRTKAMGAPPELLAAQVQFGDIHHPSFRRCTAKARSTGQRCKCRAMRGVRVCKTHGGASMHIRAAAKGGIPGCPIYLPANVVSKGRPGAGADKCEVPTPPRDLRAHPVWEVVCAERSDRRKRECVLAFETGGHVWRAFRATVQV